MSALGWKPTCKYILRQSDWDCWISQGLWNTNWRPPSSSGAYIQRLIGKLEKDLRFYFRDCSIFYFFWQLKRGRLPPLSVDFSDVLHPGLQLVHLYITHCITVKLSHTVFRSLSLLRFKAKWSLLSRSGPWKTDYSVFWFCAYNQILKVRRVGYWDERERSSLTN